MTIGEFAKKYRMPYNEIQKASFRTATRMNHSGRAWFMDFSEEELRRAVRAELNYKISFHQQHMEEAAEKLARLDGEAEA